MQRADRPADRLERGVDRADVAEQDDEAPTVILPEKTAANPNPNTSAVPNAVAVCTPRVKAVCRTVSFTRSSTAVSPCSGSA